MPARDEPRFPHKQVRQVAAWLKSIGFVFDNVDASGHPIYAWPASGAVVKLPTTPRGHAWVDAVRREACRIAGVSVSNKRNGEQLRARRDAEKAAAERRKADALAALARRSRERSEREQARIVQQRVAAREDELREIDHLMRTRPHS